MQLANRLKNKKTGSEDVTSCVTQQDKHTQEPLLFLGLVSEIVVSPDVSSTSVFFSLSRPRSCSIKISSYFLLLSKRELQSTVTAAASIHLCCQHEMKMDNSEKKQAQTT